MQTSKLYFYNGVDLFHKTSRVYPILKDKFAGMDLMLKLVKLQGPNAFFHDRSNSITTPINTETMRGLELPQYKKTTESFAEISSKRSAELMNYAKTNNKKLVVMWSGGIDSTTILVSFLTSCHINDIKDNMIILLNDLSIDENPTFYNTFIKNKLTVDISEKYPYYFANRDYVVVTGEGNDNLFGSSLTTYYIWNYGIDSIASSNFRENIVDLYSKILSKSLDKPKSLCFNDAEKLVYIQELICKSCPIPIDAAYKFLWWVNFVTRWQNVYLRLSCVADVAKTRVQYEKNYFMFFSTEEFQLWSINNADSLISDSWASYKQPCKDIIFDYDKNYQYHREKIKVGSLTNLVKKGIFALDSGLNIYDKYPGDKFFNSENTFSKL